MGDLRHDTQVVRDPDQRRTGIAAKTPHITQDLRLHGDVQRRSWFICDDQIGLVQECGGNDNSLSHTAGKLVWIGFQPFIGAVDPDTHHRLANGLPRGIGRDVSMGLNGLDHLYTNALHRVKAGGRILKDHRNSVAAQALPLRLGIVGDIGAIERNAPRSDTARPVDQSHDGQSKNGFARARLPHDAENIAARDLEINATHGRQGPVGRGKFCAQSLNRQKLCVLHFESLGLMIARS